jgi:hypothetical protein
MSPAKNFEQTLLEDIESKEIPLDKIAVVDICNGRPGIFGKPGNERPPVQARFQIIKKFTIRRRDLARTEARQFRHHKDEAFASVQDRRLAQPGRSSLE